MSRLPYFLHTNKKWIVMGLAMGLPFVAILLHPISFHYDDMQDFLRWSKAWELNWRNIYLDCTVCTYPFLGTFFSGGVLSLLDFEKTRHVVRAFHIFLAVIDALNVIITYLILKELDVEKAPLWAGVIGLLPSSWLGASYWGQIDGIGQLIIFVVILYTIRFNKKADVDRTKYSVYLIVSGLLLACLLLIKQLVLFSMICLGAMVITNILMHSRSLKALLTSLSIFGMSFFCPLFLIDTVLVLPAPYFSHIQYVLEIGSRIGDVVSSYGFNVWVLFYKDTMVSSHTPIFTLGNLEFSPFLIGIILFLLVNFLFLLFLFKYFHPIYKTGVRFLSKSDILLWVFQLSFLNLSFNIFLAGTHERYLYHFYPFIIIAFLGNSLISRKGLFVLLAGAVLYGSFLFGYLSELNSLFDGYPYYFMAIFHFFLFVYLAVVANRHFLDRSVHSQVNV